MTNLDVGASGPTMSPDDPAIGDLLRAFGRLRRLMIKPATSLVPLPSTGRRVDLAKVMACQAVADAAEIASSEGAGTSPTVKDVALALGLEHSTASRLLGEAEGEGLVVRGTDPADRRRTTVTLTDLGRSVVRESVEIQSRVLGAVLEGWERAEVCVFARLIERFAGSLHAEVPDILRQCQVDIARRTGEALARPTLVPATLVPPEGEARVS